MHNPRTHPPFRRPYARDTRRPSTCGSTSNSRGIRAPIGVCHGAGIQGRCAGDSSPPPHRKSRLASPRACGRGASARSILRVSCNHSRAPSNHVRGVRDAVAKPALAWLGSVGAPTGSDRLVVSYELGVMVLVRVARVVGGSELVHFEVMLLLGRHPSCMSLCLLFELGPGAQAVIVRFTKDRVGRLLVPRRVPVVVTVGLAPVVGADVVETARRARAHDGSWFSVFLKLFDESDNLIMRSHGELPFSCAMNSRAPVMAHRTSVSQRSCSLMSSFFCILRARPAAHRMTPSVVESRTFMRS